MRGVRGVRGVGGVRGARGVRGEVERDEGEGEVVRVEVERGARGEEVRAKVRVRG